mmetsp:Transcript_2240/g.6497  ORF Transcript_2240/g.6497 Transcript_2240/m.6497 type:complete len:352 (-) Transcript_2240:299-1354(-)
MPDLSGWPGRVRGGSGGGGRRARDAAWRYRLIRSIDHGIRVQLGLLRVPRAVARAHPRPSRLRHRWRYSRVLAFCVRRSVGQQRLRQRRVRQRRRRRRRRAQHRLRQPHGPSPPPAPRARRRSFHGPRLRQRIPRAPRPPGRGRCGAHPGGDERRGGPLLPRRRALRAPRGTAHGPHGPQGERRALPRGLRLRLRRPRRARRQQSPRLRGGPADGDWQRPRRRAPADAERGRGATPPPRALPRRLHDHDGRHLLLRPPRYGRVRPPPVPRRRGRHGRRGGGGERRVVRGARGGDAPAQPPHQGARGHGRRHDPAQLGRGVRASAGRVAAAAARAGPRPVWRRVWRAERRRC